MDPIIIIPRPAHQFWFGLGYTFQQVSGNNINILYYIDRSIYGDITLLTVIGRYVNNNQNLNAYCGGSSEVRGEHTSRQFAFINNNIMALKYTIRTAKSQRRHSLWVY